MGTPGDYGIVTGGAFYGVNQPRDGYPQAMGSRLAAEAADIDDPEWRRIAAAVQSMAWVVPEDEHVVAASAGRLAAPTHPDGDYTGDSHNFEFLVPRLSRTDAQDWARERLAARPGAASTLLTAPPTHMVTVPSFRQLAAMPAATKTRAPWSAQRSPWAAAANLDCGRFMLFDGRQNTGPAFGTVYATVPLTDRDALRALAARLAMAIASTEPPPMPPLWRASGPPPRVTDGMTRRPPGYPLLPPTPGARLPAGDSSAGADNDTEIRCMAPLSSRPGDRCRHPRPAQIGGRCQSGHVRRR